MAEGGNALSPESLPLLFAAVGGGLIGLALRELVVDHLGEIEAYARSALGGLRDAGSEGRLPSVIERRRLGVVAGLGLGSISVFLFGLGPHALVAVLGPAAAGWAIGFRRRRYLARLELELPQVAGGLADALSAGTSLRGAIEDLVPTLEGPARVELTRVRADLVAGLPIAVALAGFGRRSESAPAQAIAAAIVAQQRTGGDLAGLLRRHAGAEAARQRSIAAARSETAQARLTGGIVAAMPIAAGLLVELIAPGFIGSMTADPAAALLLAAALALQAAGFVVIRRVGSVRR